MTAKQLEMRLKQITSKIVTRQEELADLKAQQKELKDQLTRAKQADKAAAQ